jgi:hypothetical protein
MKVTIRNIKCRELDAYRNSNRESPFWVAEYRFFYQSEKFDAAILNKITAAGTALANAVKDNAANDSTTKRPYNRKLSNAIAGVLAEYCWKNFLNSISLETLVQETAYTEAASQIDLETIYGKKTIEVRSSFPRNGIEFAICSANHEFDVLGPYKNNYKPDELQKDFYLRTLFHVQTPVSFLEDYKQDGFIAYLTGGATWAMMADDTIAIEKTLIPEDSIAATEVESVYRVVPFSRAMDCNAIYQEIKKTLPVN